MTDGVVLHEMRVLGRPGDTKIIWNTANDDETQSARDTFHELVKEKHFRAYEVKEDGEPGEPITEFNPEAGKIIIVPPMAGGHA